MTNAAQKSFDVYTIADCGAVDCYCIRWPAAAVQGDLKITISEGVSRPWVAEQLRALATAIENEQPLSVVNKATGLQSDNDCGILTPQQTPTCRATEKGKPDAQID